MKLKPWASLLALSLLAAIIPSAGAYADSLTIEPTQGTVGSDIKIPAFCQYGEGDYFLYWGDGNQLIAQGNIKSGNCQPITFKCPQSARGKQLITLKVGSKSFQKEYTVLASMSLGVKKGPVGTSVSVQGSGFDKNETGISILYDGSQVATGIQANSTGGWLYTLKVPASSKSNHPISASSATTPSKEVGNQLFSVTPSISITPSSGWVGRVVSVSGQGFIAAETNIAVIYDDVLVKSNITADLTGSWQTSFTIPASAKGAHKVTTRGATTTVDEAGYVTFIVSPGIKVEQTAGRLGDVINVGDTLYASGVGFQENETNIKITLDGLQVAGGITADAHGSWSTQFTVPPSTRGEHTVNSFGDTTSNNDVTGYIVVITPELTINPTSGSVGETTLLTGSGYGASQPLTITYESSKVETSATTDAKGSFSVSFKPPASNAGNHVITVGDATGAMASASFTIESTPPPVPSPIAPEAGTKISLMDSKAIDFKWSVVDDPSGVVYSLEMSQKADFSGSVLRRDNLDKPQYSMSPTERPNAGEYYWRVRATDLAGNASNWSPSQLLFLVGFDFIWPSVIALVVLVVVGLIVWRIRTISKRGGWSS